MSSGDEVDTSGRSSDAEDEGVQESSSEEEIPPIQLPDRTTRGKRIAQVSSKDSSLAVSTPKIWIHAGSSVLKLAACGGRRLC